MFKLPLSSPVPQTACSVPHASAQVKSEFLPVRRSPNHEHLGQIRPFLQPVMLDLRKEIEWIHDRFGGPQEIRNDGVAFTAK